MNRRDALRWLGAAGAAAIAGTSGPVRAERVGETPDFAQGLFPTDRVVDSVLEILLIGGLSQYESLYCVEEFGDSASAPEQWHSFLASGDIGAAVDACGLTGGSDLLQEFAEDSAGNRVKLGPFAAGLRARPDMVDRLRLCVTEHDVLPHEVAVPLALTGRLPNQSGAAGLGAHVMRYLDSGGEASSGSAFVVTSRSSVQRELCRAAFNTGRHPSGVRPIELRIDGGEAFASLLERKSVADRRAAHDALVSEGTTRFRARLALDDASLRAPRADELAANLAALQGTEGLRRLLPADVFTSPRVEICGEDERVSDTKSALRVATHLLRASPSRKRYVCVVDGGLGSGGGAGGYDTHADTPIVQATNLTNLFSALASVVNEPGENDPEKLDLDKTMIVLNTEFGRAPAAQGNLGRAHWPYGYPVAFIGGPIRSRGIFGAIGSDARALTAAPPSVHRIATSLALGIWPFSEVTFNVGEVPAAPALEEGVAWIAREYFGLA